jgi:hypothetical protein
MVGISFKRVRTEVTELWSGEPVSDPGLVQRMVEWHSSLSVPYPSVKAVDPAHGIWDLYLPEDVVQEFDRQAANELNAISAFGSSIRAESCSEDRGQGRGGQPSRPKPQAA